MNIETLIQEYRTIATAQQGLESFEYGPLQSANANRARTYPMLLVDEQVQLESMDLNNRQRVYVFRLHFMDTYHRLEERSTAKELKQQSLEDIAEGFLQEFRARYKQQSLPWKVHNGTTVTGTWGFNKYNDKLMQLSYEVSVLVQGNCNSPTFVY